MPNIREVVHRMHSVHASRQITSAMKMVAAAKLGKAQQRVSQLRCYTGQLTEILQNVIGSMEQPIAQSYLAQRPIKNTLLVVMSSDRGLCGSFNTKVFKKALNYIQASAYGGQGVAQMTVLPIGKKAASFFEKRSERRITKYVSLAHDLTLENAVSAVDFLTKSFLQQTYDRVVLVYSAFKSATTSTPMAEQLLPIRIPTAGTTTNAVKQIDYIHEPSKADLLEALVPHVLQIQFYKAQLESNAAEHGARMTTMSKATDNADELLKELRITYNRTRQATITQEISEIVAGADST